MLLQQSLRAARTNDIFTYPRGAILRLVAYRRDRAPPMYIVYEMSKYWWLLVVPILTASNPFSLKPVRWTLVGGNVARQITSGRAVPITVQADIAKGWHIYSLTQRPGGPIPLRIRVEGADDVSLRGLIKAPKPEKYFDKNFGVTTELYSGSPRFTIPLALLRRAAPGIRRVQVTARYQVCSDRLCLPPRTDTVPVGLRISAGR